MNGIFRINDLEIAKYRGINNLIMNGFSNVNVILGNNNCGKTSILEAINLLKRPDIYNVFETTCFHDSHVMSKNDQLKKFKYAFPYNTNRIVLNANTSKGKLDYEVTYHMDKVKFDKKVFLPSNEDGNMPVQFISQYIDHMNLNGKDTTNIYGECILNGDKSPYSIVPLDLQFRNKKIINNNPIFYMGPAEHFNITPETISDILLNDNYYKMFIRVLKIFDENIVDIKLIVEEAESEPTIYIQKKNANSQPLYAYGDGIKKVFCLASYLAKSRNGILLIDEIETSLHYSYFEDIFLFIVKVAKQLNVQIFITTHSKETIESFLRLHDQLTVSDYLKLYTIRNTENQTYCGTLTEKEAIEFVFTSKMELRD